MNMILREQAYIFAH